VLLVFETEMTAASDSLWAPGSTRRAVFDPRFQDEDRFRNWHDNGPIA
jgi:hypothetical protein